MKKEQWNEGLNHLDADIVEGYIAQRERLRRKKKYGSKWMPIATAVMVLVLVSVVLIVPMLDKITVGSLPTTVPTTTAGYNNDVSPRMVIFNNPDEMEKYFSLSEDAIFPRVKSGVEVEVFEATYYVETDRLYVSYKIDSVEYGFSCTFSSIMLFNNRWENEEAVVSDLIDNKIVDLYQKDGGLDGYITCENDDSNDSTGIYISVRATNNDKINFNVFQLSANETAPMGTPDVNFKPDNLSLYFDNNKFTHFLSLKNFISLVGRYRYEGTRIEDMVERVSNNDDGLSVYSHEDLFGYSWEPSEKHFYTSVYLEGLNMPADMTFEDNITTVLQKLKIEMDPYNDFVSDNYETGKMTLYSDGFSSLQLIDCKLTNNEKLKNYGYILRYTEEYRVGVSKNEMAIIQRSMVFSFSDEENLLCNYEIDIKENTFKIE
ncbi:MAG: hypothetical protein E7675_01545 [Ruminococcaceae bacterium]|nr:hypothetical protein [Oscillospiraceae bacterium]